MADSTFEQAKAAIPRCPRCDVWQARGLASRCPTCDWLILEEHKLLIGELVLDEDES